MFLSTFSCLLALLVVTWVTMVGVKVLGLLIGLGHDWPLQETVDGVHLCENMTEQMRAHKIQPAFLLHMLAI